ncbi:uncharacterized protein BDW47DRAFT_131935 [Aspergillus candidus]|uniref:Protein kinase domain-containing protein n=1 Tax=Aspergillus candidus TaxID=41067 RepID=A0A2I2FAN3_ASPCN|nr:hypothetical protein BDW47DRAFT_131935 [Aspergillus candidus]PLB37688.1 hypothetical protein BDW47DRAFT_131935 [Aspergillus candidus]
MTDPISIAGLALAVGGTITACLKYGRQLVKLCRDSRHLEAGILDIILTIEGIWLKTETQLQSLRSIWSSLRSELQVHYTEALENLEIKLLAAIKSVDAFCDVTDVSASPHKKLRAPFLHKHLKQAMADLEGWQRRFDPSWYLITRITEPKVDARLKISDEAQEETDPSMARLTRMREAIKQISSPDNTDKTGSVFKDASVVQTSKTPIPGTTTFLASYRGVDQPILLDGTRYPATPTARTAKAYARDLARLLANVDPKTFSLLKCDGVIEFPESPNSSQFEFIFPIPQGLSNPRTLRCLLLEQPTCSLSQRVRLAKQLARSVMFVHAMGFVHKGIRPETVLIFTEDNASQQAVPEPATANANANLGPSYLVGFERTRRADGPTDLHGDHEWARNLYRHPQRQGLWPEDLYSMQHDIYSLGVCLLEIALWQSFVRSKFPSSPESADLTVPWEELDIVHAIEDKDPKRGGFAIKASLTELAERRLPALVGDVYTEVVVTCLGCLDSGEENVFGTERDLRVKLRDEDGVVVGVRFAENVLLRIEEICV